MTDVVGPDEIMDEFAALDCTDPANRTGGIRPTRTPPSSRVRRTGSRDSSWDPVELDGSTSPTRTSASETSTGTQTNRVAVTIEFDSVGREVFGQITSAITGQQQPYATSSRSCWTASSLSARLADTGDGRSRADHGDFTLGTGETLSNQLRNGALPISFQVQSEQQISPTLGSEYLAMGMLAWPHRPRPRRLLTRAVSGAGDGDGLNCGGRGVLVSPPPARDVEIRLSPSLAGVAGLIVGIGAAADSFIVYFERIRDELRGAGS